MQLKRVLEVSVLAVSGLLVALSASWLLLAAVNFSYGLWHDVGGVGDAINRYGGKNKYKEGFHLTTKAQRADLFEQINQSIHNHGEGLEEISYVVPGYEEQLLLREPEVVHLQDVANLVDAGMKVAMLAFCVWLSMWLYFAISGRPLPGVGVQSIAIGALVAVAAFIVAVIGPVDVFYWLHTVIFPDDHQWFFYYQESLMSTLMYAPVLFGWIALEWLVMSLAMFVVLQAINTKLLSVFLLGK